MSWVPYSVGHNQVVGHGDQRKLFVSKSTLIYATLTCNVKFNSMNNVAIAILPKTWYEFKSNIFQVFVQYVAAATVDDYIKLYFEGVMYDEGRRPE